MKSIKSKIIVFSLLATLIPSFGLGLLAFQQNEEMIKDNATRELRALANYASRELDLWINKNIHEASSLTSARIIIDVLSKISQSQENTTENSQLILADYLRSVHEKLDNILELTVIDTNGQIIASSSGHSSLARTDYSNWVNDITNQKQSNLVSETIWNEYYDTVTVYIAQPVLSYDGYILGLLVVTYDLQTIRPALKDPEKSPQGEILLLDASGNIHLASYTDVTHPVPLHPLAFQYLQNNPGKPAIFQDLLQKNMIGLAYLVKKLSITVIAVKNHSDVYAAGIKQRNQFLMLLSAFILVVVTISLYLGHSIVAPLHRLINATEQIVKGNFDIPIAVVTQKDEVGKLAQMFNKMTEKLRHNQAEILAANKAMQQKNQLLEKLSITDGLTGLYNRNKLTIIINDELSRFQRNKRPFAMLMIDVDHFKPLNDTLGHIAGDEILSSVAEALAQSIRNIDFAARYGGDEFIVILTEATVKDALKTADRIRSRVAKIDYKSADKTINITLSIGITQSELKDTTPTTLISRADSALYEAKRAGRNQSYAIKPDV